MSICPVVQSIDYSTTLQIMDPNRPLKDYWNEISGIAISPTQIAPSGQPVMFGHNDGSLNTFAAWDSGTGTLLKTIHLETNDPKFALGHEDWEDITIGKCGPDTTEDCIYIADTGDNRAQGSGQRTQRSTPYAIYKVREPILSELPDNATLWVEDSVSILQFDYRHSSSPTRYANCETLFIDHTGWGGQVGDLYLISKWDPENYSWNRLFHIPAFSWPDGFGKIATYSPSTVGGYSELGETFFNYTWTGADMSLDGTKIALTWTNETHLFARCPNESVATAFRQSCGSYTNPPGAANPGNQFEAVAFSPNGKRLFNLAESLDPPKIVHVDVSYDIFAKAVGLDDDYCPNYGAPIIQEEDEEEDDPIVDLWVSDNPPMQEEEKIEEADGPIVDLWVSDNPPPIQEEEPDDPISQEEEEDDPIADLWVPNGGLTPVISSQGTGLRTFSITWLLMVVTTMRLLGR